jgi:hypothetical protein
MARRSWPLWTVPSHWRTRPAWDRGTLMHTLRLSLVGTIILVLLGGPSGAVAQMDADADAVYVTPVSGETVSMDIGWVSRTAGLYSSRGGEMKGISEWSDPRVSGPWTSTFNVDVDISTGHGVIWATDRIENEGGTWEGPCRGIEYQPPEGDFFTANCWLTGDGDYAGYTFFTQIDAYQHGGPARVDHGVIFKGQPPAPEVMTDPIKVVVASRDTQAGSFVFPTMRAVSASEVSSDVLTDFAQLKGRKAVVDIPAGTPITPELLEPPSDE